MHIRLTLAAHPWRPLPMRAVSSFAAGRRRVQPLLDRVYSFLVCSHDATYRPSAFPRPRFFGTSASSLSMRCPSRDP